MSNSLPFKSSLGPSSDLPLPGKQNQSLDSWNSFLHSTRREIKLEQFEFVYFITQLRACSDLRTLLHRRRVRASFDRMGSLDCLVGTTIQAAEEAIRPVGQEVQEVQKVQSLP
jgi:hypothetical protein